MQASGHRFDPDRLHQFERQRERPALRSVPIRRSFAATDGLAGALPIISRDEANEFLVVDTRWNGVSTPLPIFDIVNGFFKSMP